MAMVIATKIPATMFHWHPEDGTLTQEASTLQGNGYRPFSRIYDDACDEGFTLVNNKTKGEATFALSYTDKKDGNIRFWSFKPTPETLKKHPGAAKVNVIIWND